MSFARYPKYKDSGVGWLGEVPGHWDVIALKRIASLRSGDSITAERIEETGEYPVFGGNGLRGFTSEFTHDGHFVLIGRQGALCGNVNYANGKFWASEHAVVVSPTKEVETVWLGEMLRAMNLGQYSVSAAQPGLSVEAISNLRTVVPPISDQVAIADFLDREIAKIDELVGEQQRLIKLLAEKRQAVISHAVTKGLNPDLTTKYSSFEWLGDVPTNWEIRRVKHVVCSFEQGWSPQCEAFPAEGDEEWGVLKVGCVNGGEFNPSENKALPGTLDPIPSLGICAGDLLISRANTRELVGSVAVARRGYPHLMLCDKLYRVRVTSSVCDPMFLSRYLSSHPARSQIEIAASGASPSMVNIGQSTILEMPIPLPPVKQQIEIVESIERETNGIVALITEAERAIALLQERRTALITAAVTGKIDVRDYAAKSEAA